MKIRKKTIKIVLGIIVALVIIYAAYSFLGGGSEDAAVANLPAMVGGC